MAFQPPDELAVIRVFLEARNVEEMRAALRLPASQGKDEAEFVRAAQLVFHRLASRNDASAARANYGGGWVEGFNQAIRNFRPVLERCLLDGCGEQPR